MTHEKIDLRARPARHRRVFAGQERAWIADFLINS